MTDRRATTAIPSGQAAAPPLLFGTATTEDLARLAGVSKKTVYRVINDSPLVNRTTRGKVTRLIEELGYAPDPIARALASQRSHLVGLVFDDATAQFVVELQNGALEQLRSCGFELVVHPCDSSRADYVEGVRRFVLQQKVHGLILVPRISEDPALVRMLDALGCNYVRIAARASGRNGHTLATRDREGGAEVARFLFTAGHREIALVTGPSQHVSTGERTRGFLDALRMRRVDIRAERIVEGDCSFESGVRAAEQLLHVPDGRRPTAIFCQNDEMAAGVYHVALGMGLRIPEHLSVVGYDNSPLAERLCPALTSVHRDTRNTGRVAAAALIRPDMLPPTDACGRPSLVVRESCGRPAGSDRARPVPGPPPATAPGVPIRKAGTS